MSTIITDIDFILWKQSHEQSCSTHSVKYICIHLSLYNIVTRIPIARQRVGKQVPRRQILNKQSIARLRNNRWGCVFYFVRAEQRWNNGVMQPVPNQRLSKHISTYRTVLWKRWRYEQQRRCFPWCLCRVLMREGSDRSQNWWGSTPRLTDWLIVSRNMTLSFEVRELEVKPAWRRVRMRVVGGDEKGTQCLGI
jgi:hypothetical protein